MKRLKVLRYQEPTAAGRFRSGQASTARAFLRKLDRQEAAKKAKQKTPWVDPTCF